MEPDPALWWLPLTCEAGAESEHECARQGLGSCAALAGAQADVITYIAQIFLAARCWGAFSRPRMPTAGDETKQKALSQKRQQ